MTASGPLAHEPRTWVVPGGSIGFVEMGTAGQTASVILVHGTGHYSTFDFDELCDADLHHIADAAELRDIALAAATRCGE
jgi:hypothetical protein